MLKKNITFNSSKIERTAGVIAFYSIKAAKEEINSFLKKLKGLNNCENFKCKSNLANNRADAPKTR